MDMQKLIDICYSTFTEIGLSINLEKSHCVRGGARRSQPCKNILINEQPIDWVKETKFPEIWIKAGKLFICDWQDAKSKFYNSSNSIFSSLGSNPPIEVCLALIRSQCLPVLTYGMCAVTLSNTDINKLSFAYNSIFYKLFKSNSKDTIEYCQYFCNYWPLVNLLDYNSYCFLRKLLISGDLCPESALDRSDYIDMLSICAKYGLLLSDSINCIKFKIWKYIQNYLDI